jgi:prolyl-tRNA synthetase
VSRDNMNKTYVRREDLHSEVAELLEKIQEKLFLQAKTVLNKSISSASNLEELKSIIDTKGGFVFCGWCQDQNCEIRVKEACGADLRVIPFDKQDLLKYPNCVYCKKKALRVAAFAQAY